MKKLYTIHILLLFVSISWAQTYNGESYRKKVTPTKNLILMIPDGTSLNVVSAARWYQIYNKQGNNLAIDNYLCGTVKTYSSNAPIADSAPATSAFVTGMPTQTQFISMYPPADQQNDLVTVDPLMAFQPLATILEAARIEKKKSVGLVVSVEFPHATPADCAAHYHNRGNYKVIGSQMAHQDLSVMFGGGTSFVTDDMKQHLSEQNVSYYANDISAFRNHKEGKAWALWCEGAMPYAIDKDTTQIPTLKEMTTKAIDILSKDKNGFFLMVEGSQVDWAAHANDAVGMITEYLDFDKAVQAAIDFAIKDGNTTVVVVPDHGNSGFSIGRNGLRSYDRATLSELFHNVSQYKRTARGLEQILLKEKPENVKAVLKQYTDIEISDEELKDLLNSQNYHAENYMKVNDGKNMNSKLVELMNKHTYFGFTSGGHTGEEVFLAAYHPQGEVPIGMNTNIELSHYMADALGLKKRLPQLTQEIFAKHTDIFDGYDYKINTSGEFPVLTVKKGKNTLVIPAHKSVAYLNKKTIDIGSVTVYTRMTGIFYLSRSLKDLLN